MDLKKNNRILDFSCVAGHFLLEIHHKSKRLNLKLNLFGLDIARAVLGQ